MPVVIHANCAATLAADNHSHSNSAFERSRRRLVSGSPPEDPTEETGEGVSMRLSLIAQRLDATAQGIVDAISYLQAQDGALAAATRVLQRLGELRAVQFDPSHDDSEPEMAEAEFKSLRAQLVAIAGEKFDDRRLFGSVGYEVETTAEPAAAAVKIDRIDLLEWDDAGSVGPLATVVAAGRLADADLAKVASALEMVAGCRARNGNQQSRLRSAAERLTAARAKAEAANSRITDVEVAQESTAQARFKVLGETGAAMLSQTSSASEEILKLIAA